MDNRDQEKELLEIRKHIKEFGIHRDTMKMAKHHAQLYMAYRNYGLSSEQAADIIAAMTLAIMEQKRKR